MGKRRVIAGHHIHTKWRCLARYGIHLSNDDIHTIVVCIKNNQAIFLRSHTDRVTEWEVEFDGTIIRVLYDKKWHTLVTCLPPKEKN